MMSLIKRSTSPESSICDDISCIGEIKQPQKVLDEDEYLDRMSNIIRRDFFSDEEAFDYSTPWTDQTPGTRQTQISLTDSVRSRQESCSMRLNDFLDMYTNEDNAYFDKIQRKELKRHRAKYPWLYNKSNHNEEMKQQLKLPSIEQQASNSSNKSNKMIDWPYNPKNSLFYPPKTTDDSKRIRSTVNYQSNKYYSDPIFKAPLPKPGGSIKTFRGRNDKIGVDGKLADCPETPVINGYSFVPPPESPGSSALRPNISYKTEPKNYYFPSQSPRDELTHKLYEQRVAKSIRTPKLRSSTKMSLHDTPSTSYTSHTMEYLASTPDCVKSSSTRRLT